MSIYFLIRFNDCDRYYEDDFRSMDGRIYVDWFRPVQSATGAELFDKGRCVMYNLPLFAG